MGRTDAGFHETPVHGLFLFEQAHHQRMQLGTRRGERPQDGVAFGARLVEQFVELRHGLLQQAFAGRVAHVEAALASRWRRNMRALVQSRLTVAGDVSRKVAISSISMPPKKRSSTTR